MLSDWCLRAHFILTHTHANIVIGMHFAHGFRVYLSFNIKKRLQQVSQAPAGPKELKTFSTIQNISTQIKEMHAVIHVIEYGTVSAS